MEGELKNGNTRELREMRDPSLENNYTIPPRCTGTGANELNLLLFWLSVYKATIAACFISYISTVYSHTTMGT